MNFSTYRLRLLDVGLLLSVLAIPSVVCAQQPAPGPRATHQQPGAKPRYRTSFELPGPNTKVRLSIEPTVAKQKWAVSVVDAKTGDTALREPIPDWIVAPHYGYEVAAARLSPQKTAVIMAALPGVHGKAPPPATQFQVVWVVQTEHGKSSWKRLDTAQYSVLDGGERFEFRKAHNFKSLIRRHRGHDSIFCGASAADPVLFDRYKPQSGKFEQQLDIKRLIADAARVETSPSAADFKPPMLAGWYQWFAASSDRRSPNERGALIRPLELGDGKVDTGWLEGAKGLGRGEFVSAQVNDAVGLSSIRVVPGLGGDKSLYRAFAHPTRLLIGLSNGKRYIVKLDHLDFDMVASGRGVTIDLPEPQKTRCMSVMVLDAKRGARVKGQPSWTRDTVAISEITPYSVLHGKDAEQTAARVVARIANEKNARTRERIAELALTIKRQLVGQVRRAVREGTPAQRRRIIPLMATLPADEAVPMLVDFLRKTDTDAPEYRAIKRSLAAHYTEAAPGLIAVLQNGSLKDSRKYADVLRLLGRVGKPKHLVKLIDRLGQGDRMIRNERIRALGAGGEALVEPLLVHARSHVNTPAGLDALRALSLLGKRLHFNDQGPMPRPEIYGALLEHTTSRPAMLRALRVAKFFHADGFVKAAHQKYAADDDALVRKATVEALGRYPSDQARSVIVAALSDKSPDVRIAAVKALSQRKDVSKVLDAVVAYSRRERWKAGLQHAFRVLAAIDNPTTARAFEARFRNEPNTAASLLAAHALDRASRSIDAKLACSLVKNADINLDMRVAMLDLLGLDHSQRGEKFLLGLLDHDGWTKLSKGTRARRRLRNHLMLSLGRRRSAEAMPHLLDTARSDDSVAARRVALRALAFYNDKGLLDDLTEWQKRADPRLKSALDQTITMIERRQSLESVRQGLDDVLAKDKKSETNPNADTSKGSMSE